jgi:putative transposase
MTRRRHSPAEISAKLKQADELATAGKLQSEIARELGISVMTFHRWRKRLRHPTMPGPSLAYQSSQQNHLLDMELENSRLRRILADLLLENVKLEEAAGTRVAYGHDGR